MHAESLTRTATAGRDARSLPTWLTTITSPESGIRYRIGTFVGEGAFGRAYRVNPVGRPRSGFGGPLCLKISSNQECWIREAYFARLLQDQPRAVKVVDVFVCPIDGYILYCLVTEYAIHGHLQRYLEDRRKPMSERRARQQMIGLLSVLDTLHKGHALHRDLTPFNVFVCEGETLKLGDFGIARHHADKRGLTADMFNRINAPDSIIARSVGRWQARDDVFQVGQLLAMLIKGDASERLTTGEVAHLHCSDGLKEVIHRCIGQRHKRFESAGELIDALRQPAERIVAGRIRSLSGQRVVFTGHLRVPRWRAAAAAKAIGAFVDNRVSARTTVVVRGRPNVGQAAGEIGLKLMDVKRLQRQGARIKVISEPRFWALVDEP